MSKVLWIGDVRRLVSKLQEEASDQYERLEGGATVWSVLYFIACVILWFTPITKGDWTSLLFVGFTMSLAAIVVIRLWVMAAQAKARLDLLRHIAEKLEK